MDVFRDVTPALGTEADRFFSDNRIDAEPRRGKTSGASCLWPSTRVPGFVYVNWTGQLRDLVMLAHRARAWDQFATGRAGADRQLGQTGQRRREIPSTIAELLLVEHLLSTDEDLGRALLARELDEAVTVAYMSAAFARFEQAAYALRAEGQALTADRLNALCEAAVAKVWGDAGVGPTSSAAAGSTGRRCRAFRPLPLLHLRLHLRVPARRRAGGPLARARLRRALRAFPHGRRLGVARGTLAVVGVDLGDPEIWNDGFAGDRTVSSSVCPSGGAVRESPADSVTHRRPHLTPH